MAQNDKAVGWLVAITTALIGVTLLGPMSGFWKIALCVVILGGTAWVCAWDLARNACFCRLPVLSRTWSYLGF